MKMIFCRSRMLFVILCFGCCFFVTCNDFLLLLKSDEGDVCITNSSSPLIHTLPDGTIKEDTKLIPETAYHCNFGENVSCTEEFIKSTKWKVVISSDYENIPIFDMRWLDLPVEVFSSNEPKIVPVIGEFTFTLSLRASDIQFVFCDEKDTNLKGFCYGFSVNETSCCLFQSNVVPGTTKEENPRYTTCENKKYPDQSYIEMEKWTHLTFEKRNEYIYLKRIENEINEIILRHKVQNKISIKYMIATSKSTVYYKSHTYRYLRTAISPYTHKSQIKPTMIKNNKICFSLYMTTCNSCSIEAFAYSKSKGILSSKILPSSHGKWTEYKIIFNIKNHVGNKYVNIGFVINGTDNNDNNFWAIDSLRHCNFEEYRVSKEPITDLKKCELLYPSKNLVWRSPNEIKSTECKPSDLTGEICIPCKELNDAHIVSNCEKLRVCEMDNDVGKCFCQSGFKGDECQQECEQGTFGRECLQNCSCSLNGECNKMNGTCECDDLFEGYTCHLPINGNILKKAAVVISSHPTSCVIRFDRENYGKRKPLYYLLQYQKENSGGNVSEWSDFESLKSIYQNDEIKIENLKMSTKYYIRILVSSSYRDIKLLENASIPFTICNTTCNEWVKKDINIKEDNQTIFVNIETSNHKCSVTLYNWIIKTIEGDEILNGSTQNAMNFTELPGGKEFLMYFLGPNSKNISKTFNTSEKAPGPPEAFQSYFLKNNTFGIVWKNPKNPNGILKNFEVIFYIPSKNFTIDVKAINNPEKIDEYYNRQITEPIPPSEDVKVEVIAINSVKGKPAIISNSSYPSPPHLLHSGIDFRNSTATSISGEFDMRVAIKEHHNKKKNHFYIYILVSGFCEGNEDENVKTLEKLVQDKVDAGGKCRRIVAEFDLNDVSTSLLKFSIGRHIEQESKLLNGCVIMDRPLKPDQFYNITILLVSRYKNKFRITSDKRGIATQKLPKMNEHEGQYALLLLLLLIPIVLVLIIFRKKIYQAMATFSLQKIMCIKVLNTSQSESDILAAEDCTPEIQNLEMKLKTWTSKVNKYMDPPNPDEEILSKPVKIANLERYVRETIESGELLRQHALFSESHTQPCTYGSLPENKNKNRYNNLIAYDHSRVRLDKFPGNEFSDYINANFIHGYRVPNAFIATQGPKQSTLVDFWRMVWEKNVKHIIMMANIYESGKKKVEQYWPNVNEELRIGQICIKFIAVEIYADFEYKTFNIERGSEIRKIEQLHFTSWPDHGVPLYPQSLVPFLRKMLKIRMSSSHPVVIHCSAGVGRTGTILLSDICLRMAAKEGAVDLLNNLQKLRQQRPRMVDNVEQYKLAHLVIIETLMGLHTSIPCNMMEQAMEKLLSTEEYKIQMDYLIQTQWKDDAMKSVAEADENFVVYRMKNRFPQFVPDNKCRILLAKYPESDSSSSYINAIKVDGFRNSGRFIVTQTPMPNTLSDFWRLVMEQQTRVIISLNALNLDDETCCQFFPNVNNPEIRPVDFLLLQFKKTQKMKEYDIHFVNMRVRNKEEQNFDIIVLSFKLWKCGEELPSNHANFLSFWEESDTISRRSKRVLVTCYDGRTASGIYVAISFIIEKIKLEQECDVCLAVRSIRHNRKQFLASEVVTKMSETIMLKGSNGNHFPPSTLISQGL